EYSIVSEKEKKSGDNSLVGFSLDYDKNITILKPNGVKRYLLRMPSISKQKIIENDCFVEVVVRTKDGKYEAKEKIYLKYVLPEI
ncbi:MAG: hypothetical protein J7K00_05365, partial [Candidatus Diapherotrites archaeon]|nr:hypothetical protein [Candidatus Diapherotrites archaeon]